jgi:hypothetical protein
LFDAVQAKLNEQLNNHKVSLDFEETVARILHLHRDDRVAAGNGDSKARDREAKIRSSPQFGLYGDRNTGDKRRQWGAFRQPRGNLGKRATEWWG